MAILRYNTGVRERTLKNINYLKHKEIRATFPTHVDQLDSDVSTMVNRLEWTPEFTDLLGKIPHSWIRQVRSANLYIDDTGPLTLTDLRSAYARPRPQATFSYDPLAVRVTFDEIAALPDGMAGKVEVLEWLARCKEVDAISAKWDGIMGNLDNLMRQCKSVNEAIKHVPAVRVYLDEGDLDVVDRKYESRAARAGALTGVDLGPLSAVAAMMKLSEPHEGGIPS